MIKQEHIKTFSDALIARYSPRRIVVFGSYASGTPRWDSDVDIFIEMDFEGSGLGVAAQIVKDLDPPFSVDLIVKTPAQVRARLAMKDQFLQSVFDSGKVLYEATYG